MTAPHGLLISVVICVLQMVGLTASSAVVSQQVAPALPPVPTMITQSTDQPVGTPITLTADVERQVPGMLVVFEIGAGEFPTLLEATLNGSGRATAEHVSAVESTDTIGARSAVPDGEDDDGNLIYQWGGRSTPITVTWVEVVEPPAVTVELSPRTSTGEVMSSFSWTATVMAGGEPASGASVTFRAEMSGQEDVVAELTADAAGKVTNTHTRTVPGNDRLSVSATAGDGFGSATGSREWTAIPEVVVPDPLLVELTPAASAGEVGSSFTWTATVTSDGGPVSGASVSFLGQMPGQDDEAASGTTNADGRASHTHSRTEAGMEDVMVVATEGEREASDSGQREWTPEDDPPTPPKDPPPVEDPPPPIEDPNPDESTPQEPNEAEELEPKDGLTPIPPTDDLSPDDPSEASDELDFIETELASVVPGGDLALGGSGCQPGAKLEVALAGVPLGETTADPDGAFAARFAVPDVPLGQYVVTATCGDAVGETVIDVLTPVSAGIGGAQITTTALVLAFFVLLGSSLVRGLSGQGVTPTGP